MWALNFYIVHIFIRPLDMKGWGIATGSLNW